MTKAELLAEAEERGLDVDESSTVAEIKAALGGNGERVCPNCGETHGSSLVPESEMSHLADQGVKLSALPKADVYRIFRCDGAFYPVPHDAKGDDDE